MKNKLGIISAAALSLVLTGAAFAGVSAPGKAKQQNNSTATQQKSVKKQKTAKHHKTKHNKKNRTAKTRSMTKASTKSAATAKK